MPEASPPSAPLTRLHFNSREMGNPLLPAPHLTMHNVIQLLVVTVAHYEAALQMRRVARKAPQVKVRQSNECE